MTIFFIVLFVIAIITFALSFKQPKYKKEMRLIAGVLASIASAGAWYSLAPPSSSSKTADSQTSETQNNGDSTDTVAATTSSSTPSSTSSSASASVSTTTGGLFGDGTNPTTEKVMNKISGSNAVYGSTGNFTRLTFVPYMKTNMAITKIRWAIRDNYVDDVLALNIIFSVFEQYGISNIELPYRRTEVALVEHKPQYQRIINMSGPNVSVNTADPDHPATMITIDLSDDPLLVPKYCIMSMIADSGDYIKVDAGQEIPDGWATFAAGGMGRIRDYDLDKAAEMMQNFPLTNDRKQRVPTSLWPSLETGKGDKFSSENVGGFFAYDSNPELNDNWAYPPLMEFTGTQWV